MNKYRIIALEDIAVQVTEHRDTYSDIGGKPVKRHATDPPHWIRLQKGASQEIVMPFQVRRENPEGPDQRILVPRNSQAAEFHGLLRIELM